MAESHGNDSSDDTSIPKSTRNGLKDRCPNGAERIRVQESLSEVHKVSGAVLHATTLDIVADYHNRET